MTVTTAKRQSSVHRTSGMPGMAACIVRLVGDDVMSWSFGDDEMKALEADAKGRDIEAEIRASLKTGRRFFDPEACANLFFLALDALDGRDEKDILWRLYDAILVGAYTGSNNQTGMLIEA